LGGGGMKSDKIIKLIFVIALLCLFLPFMKIGYGDKFKFGWSGFINFKFTINFIYLTIKDFYGMQLQSPHLLPLLIIPTVEVILPITIFFISSVFIYFLINRRLILITSIVCIAFLLIGRIGRSKYIMTYGTKFMMTTDYLIGWYLFILFQTAIVSLTLISIYRKKNIEQTTIKKLS
jgi:hypothetical protein